MMSHRLLTLWYIASVFGCPEELDSKTILMKTTHGLVREHEEIKVILNLDIVMNYMFVIPMFLRLTSYYVLNDLRCY